MLINVRISKRWWYGRCGNCSSINLTMFAIETAQVWRHALSSWPNKCCFSKSKWTTQQFHRLRLLQRRFAWRNTLFQLVCLCSVVFYQERHFRINHQYGRTFSLYCQQTQHLSFWSFYDTFSCNTASTTSPYLKRPSLRPPNYQF